MDDRIILVVLVVVIGWVLHLWMDAKTALQTARRKASECIVCGTAVDPEIYRYNEERCENCLMIAAQQRAGWRVKWESWKGATS